MLWGHQDPDTAVTAHPSVSLAPSALQLGLMGTPGFRAGYGSWLGRHMITVMSPGPVMTRTCAGAV